VSTERQCIILQHDADGPPGTIGAALREKGVPFAIRHLYAGQSLPAAEECGSLIVLGGEMNVVDDDRHPWLVTERELLRACVERSVPVLGICLGAQQLALAAGGEVYRRETSEVGWLPIEVHERDGIFAGLPASVSVLEWHDYSFHAPPEAHLLAVRPDGEQAFLVGGTAWGLQFHPEITATTLDAWIEEEACGPYAKQRGPLLDELRQQREFVVRQSEYLCRTLVTNFIASWDQRAARAAE
jgi:GMP synthase-like glutamine amidotransferase